MSSFDLDFRHFSSASGYRNRRTDHEEKFNSFRSYVIDGEASSLTESFVIQFVCHPNFQANRKTVAFFKLDCRTGKFDEFDELPPGPQSEFL